MNGGNELLLHVAPPRECNTQQTTPTLQQTLQQPVQQPSVKGLAYKVLERNRARNTGATKAENACNNVCNKTDRLLHGLSEAELQTEAGEDWAWLKDDPAALRALAHAITIKRMRECGEVPPHYTATTTCQHCGRVPIFEGCPPAVEGCPWCFNRVAGLSVPRIEKTA